MERFRDYAAYRLGRKEPESNTLIATKPIPTDQGGAESFSAELHSDTPWRAEGESLSLTLVVRNTGRSFWPTGGTAKGVVTIGPYIQQSDGSRLELPRKLLPRALAPGDELEVELSVPRSAVGDSRQIAVDCVREGIAWFADLGSTPLVAPLE